MEGRAAADDPRADDDNSRLALHVIYLLIWRSQPCSGCAVICPGDTIIYTGAGLRKIDLLLTLHQ